MSIVSGQTTTTVAGQTAESTISGETSTTTHAGQTILSTAGEQTPVTTVSGQTTASTASSQTPVTTVEGQTTVSGETPAITQPGQTTISGETPASTQPGQTTVSGQSPVTTQPGQTTVNGETSAGTQPGETTVSGETPGTTLPGQTTHTTLSTTGTTTKKCDEMPAIDEETARLITVSPTDLPESEKVSFQPTSPNGVSFPSDETAPTITVNFGKPAEVQSVVLPRDKTPNANVEQFEVTFYSPDGQKINEQPVKSTVSPADDTKTPASLNPSDIPSDKSVSRIDIKIMNTTDGQSPKGVILDIKACTEISSSKF